MSTLHGTLALLLLLSASSGLAQEKDFDKLAPIPPSELGGYSGEQIFEAAREAYVCAFLMQMANQNEKAQLLRYFSARLMAEDSVRNYGKHWNDVNFPGALEAFSAGEAYAKQFKISQVAAAHKILNGPRCSRLNGFTEWALELRRKP